MVQTAYGVVPIALQTASMGVEFPAPNSRSGFRQSTISDMVSSMLYFAYGSNLNFGVFRQHLINHGVDATHLRNPRRAILRDHRLRTNYLSCIHDAGACNIEPARGQVVEGVVMEITEGVRSALRAKEGWPGRYEEVEIEVILPPSRASVAAFTYVVSPAHRLDRDQPVSPEYRRIILDGAEAAGLTRRYLGQLRRVLLTTSGRDAVIPKSSQTASG